MDDGDLHIRRGILKLSKRSSLSPLLHVHHRSFSRAHSRYLSDGGPLAARHGGRARAALGAECIYAYNQYAERAPVLLAAPAGPARTARAHAARRLLQAAVPTPASSVISSTTPVPRAGGLRLRQDENCATSASSSLPAPHTAITGAPAAPGARVHGLTEARRYMTYCGKLVTPAAPAVLLNDCVCDGGAPICESSREKHGRPLLRRDMASNARSSGGSDGGLEEYYDEDYERSRARRGGTTPKTMRAPSPASPCRRIAPAGPPGLPWCPRGAYAASAIN
uniref:Uncharacterized protein n=1 Tax=Malurus cyaneus samueli TaxID=2593467 RepID=A0A8C5UA35_9PASS